MVRDHDRSSDCISSDTNSRWILILFLSDKTAWINVNLKNEWELMGLVFLFWRKTGQCSKYFKILWASFENKRTNVTMIVSD